MGFLSKALTVMGTFLAAAVVVEQSGVSEKFVAPEKKDLVGKYINEYKKLMIIKKSIDKKLSNLKNNIAAKSKMTQISSIEDGLIPLDTEYEMFLESKIDRINSMKEIFGDLFLSTSNIIKVTYSMSEYHGKYKEILNKISELDSNLEIKK